jgi:addiction module RelE/StbE family toxin
MRLVWSAEAIRKLEDIRDYLSIEQKAPEAAFNVVSNLVGRAPDILEHPKAGRQVPEYQHPSVREILINPYRMIYSLQDDQILILTVMHQRQLMPSYRDIIKDVREQKDSE